ncbi:DNA polymerase III subunit delta' [Enterococcus dongliensis]|uniref:DNA polymerase III subunit delta n=1 Tax=Enterococcus dongliensis TaxID=2559925 RepID=A0AAP5TZY9_9ENTE|nr:DNA polymerase III subunit delta' [Enterococcus dongliensis]MDT2595483.1 DNA polymerase III subunit delta' [Enterococcus dongliensis]MDT2603302.1 DNA polymerase III subunit delta' [Enterococcus dongliensis]MDT2633664.1 DNA polymerase III subunit delta' [Enterococcus dongliensis]MDT2635962.1 DNA polymerase III subunit delta' [Enterococcus dongliensis]MDT2639764.1 DNA polymerase III subunit delta' [Enterococcus dongliensis]
MNEAQKLQTIQPIVFRQLQNSFEHGRLAHAYLFEGDQGTGKAELALWFVKHLFCLALQDGMPCEKCNNCLRIASKDHPDVVEIEPDGQSIKVDQIRALQGELAKSGFESAKKVVIIHQAEKMNVSSANSLLKFLEEPSANFMIILETQSLGKILPTIRSRCQIIHFQGLSTKRLQARLEAEQIPAKTAELLANLTNSYGKAVEISKDEWFNEARDAVIQWFNYLEKNDPQAFIYVQKKLVKTFKDKIQQQFAFELLAYFVKEKRNQLMGQKQSGLENYNRWLEEVLSASQKLEANVSFQNIAEQITLHIVFA